MTCNVDGKSCETPRRRGAWIVLGAFAAIFTALSVFSFLDSRGQVTPDQVSYAGHEANQGKRVFQAYNCMDCHTLVGNGAYLGPDLTKEYAAVGPAWLEAFLPSAGGWPTRAAVQVQLQRPQVRKASGVDTIEAYLDKYPGAAQRIERRGGGATLMPNLPFREGEVGQLIAYMRYTSQMNTEGWPPKVLVKGFERRLQLAHGTPAVVQPAVAKAATSNAGTSTLNLAAQGKQLVATYACTACHSSGTDKLVGPGWGGLYGHGVTLADGSTVIADDAYLARSIVDPHAQVVAGYPQGVMPSYQSLLKPDEVKAIVAYLQSLEKQP